MTKLLIGQVIDVKSSEFLGTPACEARVVDHFDDQGYTVRELDADPADEDAEFQVDFEGYVLVGPPLNGRLVRA